MAAAHKPFIKSDKLGRICGIYWMDDPSRRTPQEFKETLNMFQGRQLVTNLRDCFDYLKLSIAKQGGSQEAAEALTNLHYKWNGSWRYQDVDAQ